MAFMQLPQWLARFNRYVTNPVQRMWAGWAPTMGILEHVGRKSGKPYPTPLSVFSTDDGVAILLTYGPNRDWLKNIMSAGGARMRRYGWRKAEEKWATAPSRLRPHAATVPVTVR